MSPYLHDTLYVVNNNEAVIKEDNQVNFREFMLLLILNNVLSNGNKGLINQIEGLLEVKFTGSPKHPIKRLPHLRQTNEISKSVRSTKSVN